MKWEELTAVDFKKALKKSAGTCIIPLGCIEKHGEHLPLGTDLFNVSELACRIAEKEPVVVFPPYYLTQIQEAKHQPGTIAIKPELILKLLENACDETGRNGFKKIILLNGHGGNNFLQYFVMSIMLARKKSYVLYLIDGTNQKYSRLREKIIATKYDMHGGETETSITMFSAPELVKMECLTKTR